MSWLRGGGRGAAAFASTLLATLLRRVGRLSQYAELPAPPLSQAGLLGLCDGLTRAGLDGVVERAAVLFGVAMMLRQSNFQRGTAVGQDDQEDPQASMGVCPRWPRIPFVLILSTGGKDAAPMLAVMMQTILRAKDARSWSE